MARLVLLAAWVLSPALYARSGDEQEARNRFHADMRESGRLHELWLEARAAAPASGQAANHLYESLARAAWEALPDEDRAKYLAAAKRTGGARGRALLQAA